MKSKARLLIETLGQVLVGAVRDKQLLADQDITKKRLEVCGGCEYLDQQLSCQKCGCRMAYKARLKAARCPIKKW